MLRHYNIRNNNDAHVDEIIAIHKRHRNHDEQNIEAITSFYFYGLALLLHIFVFMVRFSSSTPFRVPVLLFFD